MRPRQVAARAARRRAFTTATRRTRCSRSSCWPPRAPTRARRRARQRKRGRPVPPSACPQAAARATHACAGAHGATPTHLHHALTHHVELGMVAVTNSRPRERFRSRRCSSGTVGETPPRRPNVAGNAPIFLWPGLVRVRGADAGREGNPMRFDGKYPAAGGPFWEPGIRLVRAFSGIHKIREVKKGENFRNPDTYQKPSSKHQNDLHQTTRRENPNQSFYVK